MGASFLVFIKITLLFIFILLSLMSIAVIRTLILPKIKVFESCKVSDEDYISEHRGVINRFSKSLQFITVSHDHHNYNRTELSKFNMFITKSFPQIHSSPFVKKEIVNNYSLLYSIQGKNSQLKPYMLAGHMDVVPVDEDHWNDPPFSGKIKDNYVIGRGSIDAKHIVMGILEAVEFLLENGYQPERSFYLAFGHDEEVNGLDGAAHIGKLLKSRNVSLEYILDEGSFVMDSLIPKIQSPIALIGVTEKGILNLKLSVETAPGHSSFPSKETAIIILSKALAKLEGNIFPSKFGQGSEVQLFENLAYCAPFPMKVVFSNLWLFQPFVVMFMSDPIMSAIHRTTIAVTIVEGGTKVNVLPSYASATVNMRIHPAESVAEVKEFIQNVINDARISIKVLHETPPHPVSGTNTFGFATIKKSIQQIYNDSCVVPTTMIANTDTKWYLSLSKSIYRFSLVRMTPKETNRFHGHNEKIEVRNYLNVVNFYLHLIKNSDVQEIALDHIHDDL